MADTFTTNINLTKPADGDTNWGEKLRGNYDTIDTEIASLKNRVTTAEGDIDSIEQDTDLPEKVANFQDQLGENPLLHVNDATGGVAEFGFYGGIIGIDNFKGRIADGKILLTNSAINFIEASFVSDFPAGTYYVKYTWVDASGETLASPEASLITDDKNKLNITLPAFPSGVTSANIYISTATGTETLQGSTTSTEYAQKSAITTGTALPSTSTAAAADPAETPSLWQDGNGKISANTSEFTDGRLGLFEVDVQNYGFSRITDKRNWLETADITQIKTDVADHELRIGVVEGKVQDAVKIRGKNVPSPTSAEDQKTLVYDLATDAMVWKADQVNSKKRAVSFYIDGTLAVETGAMSFIAPMTLVIKEVRLSVDTAPTGADLIIDVNKNGSTIFTTQANRPTITASTTSATSAAPDVVNLVVGDKISIDIDQVGSTAAGDNLAVSVICEEG